MIESGVIKRKSQKLFEGDSIVDLGFQLRIGIDLEPLLEQKAFHKEKRRIGAVSLEAFTDGIVSEQERFDSGPINDPIDFFHSLDGPVLFHGVKNGDVGEGKVGFHIFKAHDSSKQLNLKELCHKQCGCQDK